MDTCFIQRDRTIIYAGSRVVGEEQIDERGLGRGREIDILTHAVCMQDLGAQGWKSHLVRTRSPTNQQRESYTRDQ